MLPPDDRVLLEQVLAAPPQAQRRAVAKAITLLESSRADHRARADAFLTALPPPPREAFRVGVSGVPGVGKSTFVETLGLHLVGRGHRVAVLAVDPSSSVSGGSILGDKTRMERLSVNPAAYVRPSPSRGTLGGVATATREAIRVVEAAGYDVVVVETVGVGQSEAAVAGMTDIFVLLQLPNAGDDLQAIKKGVMELADLVVVNKADLDAGAATRAVAQIASAIRLVARRGDGAPAARVLTMSALDPAQVAAVWDAIGAFRVGLEERGAFEERRRGQARAWLWERIDTGLRETFRAHPDVRSQLDRTLADVDSGRLPVSVAARRLLAAFGADVAKPAGGY
ncbi:MAG: methylmalonyl Co-A mutase-associated GTPase MeaB [Rhizobacter sp.]|nr:methylmalonyl Co-A mutase-associated GTPase MeaB [Rhizobacter sp.]